MKVAICISGIPKFWQHSKKSIDRYFPNADVFVHMWNIDDATKIKMNKRDTGKLVYSPYSYTKYEQITEDLLVNTFSPKSYLIEHLNDRVDHFESLKQTLISECKELTGAARSISLVSMFYGIEKANSLRKQYENQNNFKYDIVVRMRFDSNIHEPRNYGGLNNSVLGSSLGICNNIRIVNKNGWLKLDDNEMVIPEGQDYGGVNDQFWFCASDVFDITSSTYSNLYDAVKVCRKYHPETIFKAHLGNLKIKRIPIFVGINGI